MFVRVAIGFFTVLLVAFSGCREKNCDEGYLTSEERAWICYDENQRVIFTNSVTSQRDTFVADAPIIEFVPGGYSYGQDDCGPHGTEKGYQKLRAPLNTGYLEIDVMHDYGRTSTGARLNGDEIPDNAIPQLNINGHDYNNVYFVQYDSASLPSNVIWRYYINKEFGILEMDRMNGEKLMLTR